MLTGYVQAAMRRAHYEMAEDGKPYFGTIPGCEGVWAVGATLEECREELQSVLEDWIVLGLRLGHSMPVIDGVAVGLPRDVEASYREMASDQQREDEALEWLGSPEQAKGAARGYPEPFV